MTSLSPMWLLRRLGVAAALLALSYSALLAQANSPSAADGFDPNVDGLVQALATQNDGKIIVAGRFTSLQPYGDGVNDRINLARINANGSIDDSFRPAINGIVNAVVIQPNGQIVIAGQFTSIQPFGSSTAITRNRIARLNTDGSVDTSFSPSINAAAGTTFAEINALTLQADGQILIGGDFVSVTPTGSTTAVARNRIARLKADGTLDTAFNPNADRVVTAITVQADGKILIGGGFTTLQPTGATAAITRNRIARLNADGTLDTTFDPNADNTVATFAIQPDGKILVGGYFSTFQPNAATTATTRNRFARLNADGTVDSAYAVNIGGPVTVIKFQADGGVLIGGSFGTVLAVGDLAVSARANVARLSPSGALDTNFNPSANAAVTAIIPQADGKILLGGSFSTISGLLRGHLARVEAAGYLDADFNVGANGNFQTLAVQTDGKILVGGNFTMIGGFSRRYLARLNTDNTVDATFDAQVNAAVNTVVVQADGKILIAGDFTSVTTATGAVARNGFARLTSTGALDTAFDPNPSAQPIAIAIQSDNKIVIGGGFSTLTPNGATTSTIRNYIARLNADGTLDTAFDPNASSTVVAIKIQSDGKLVVAGNFAAFTPNGSTTAVPRNYIARLNTDGTVDSAFNTRASSVVVALGLQSDGKIVIGGQFIALQGSADTTATPRNYIARLNADGTIDTTFDPNANNALNTILVQPSDGKIVIGGAFTTLQPNKATNWTGRKYIARLNTDGTVDPTFDLDLSERRGTQVITLALQPGATATSADFKILLSGNFTTIHPSTPANAPVTPAYHLARVTAAGALDTTFNPSGATSSVVNAIAVLPDGRTMVGGGFSNFAGTKATNLARFAVDGSPDNTFNPSLNPGFNGAINAIVAQPGGTVYVAGAFTNYSINGTKLDGTATVDVLPIPYFARFVGDEAPDGGYVATPNAAVNAILVQSDGRVVIGGAFTTIKPNGTLAPVTRNGLARLNTDGTLDTTYNSNVTGTVNALAAMADGSAVVGGAFTAVGGVARSNLARVTPSGALDASFNPNVTGAVSALVVQPDGRIIIAGVFTNVGGVSRNRIARLNADGTLDLGFNPNADGEVRALALRSDGKILVGGAFATMGASARNRLALLNADGTVDGTFDPNADGTVNAVALGADGKPYVGGNFSRVSTQSRFRLARLATTTPVSQIITVASDLSTVTWTRGGSSPELTSVSFEQSADGVSWSSLGSAPRVGPTGVWSLGGLFLPGGAPAYVRARGIVASAQSGSSGVVESIRQFYSNPAPRITSVSSTTGAAGANFAYASQAAYAPTSFSATGLPAGLSIDKDTGLITGKPTQTGTFNVTLSTSNANGTSTSVLVLTIGAATTQPVGRLVNLSSRAQLATNKSFIAGFAIGGTSSKTVLLRAVGPGLSSFGVAGTLASPRLRLYDSSGKLRAENSVWGGGIAQRTLFAQLGAFPLAVTSTDAVVVVTLEPGAYSMEIADAGVYADGVTGGGVVLAEIYDAGETAPASASRLLNLSVRAQAGAGAATLTTGFVYSGATPKRLLVRGVGPALSAYGVQSPITDPLVSVYDARNILLSRNDNWGTPVTVNSAQPAPTAADLTAASGVAGAFLLPNGSLDAATIVTVPGGIYTTQVTGAGGAGGEALLEIYELP